MTPNFFFKNYNYNVGKKCQSMAQEFVFSSFVIVRNCILLPTTGFCTDLGMGAAGSVACSLRTFSISTGIAAFFPGCIKVLVCFMEVLIASPLPVLLAMTEGVSGNAAWLTSPVLSSDLGAFKI